jgi:hypothetical protein
MLLRSLRSFPRPSGALRRPVRLLSTAAVDVPQPVQRDGEYYVDVYGRKLLLHEGGKVPFYYDEDTFESSEQVRCDPVFIWFFSRSGTILILLPTLHL